MITTTVTPKISNACPGEEVYITCVTRNSLLLLWTSDEYIGPGGIELEFAIFNDIGDTVVSPINPNTVATLINNTNEDGMMVLVSQLRIVTSVNFSTSSVSCVNEGGMSNSSAITILGMYFSSYDNFHGHSWAY